MIITVTDSIDAIAPEAVGVAITVFEGTGGSGGGGGAVDSVNGQTGVVVLDATDVGADPTGTAAAAVAALGDLATQAELDAHVADTTDAHALAGITGLQAALDAKAATTVTDALDTRLDALEAVDNATQAELDAHAADTTAVHGIADTTVLATDTEVATAVSDHAAAADPHTGYVQESALNELVDDRVAALLLEGDNITLTYDDAAGSLTIDAAAGGGGAAAAYAFPIDIPAASPDAWDYEFDAATTSLPSGWSWVNQGTSSYQEQNGGGAITAQQLAATSWRCLVKAIPAGSSWTVIGKYTIHATSLSGVIMGGPVLRNSSSGKLSTFGLRTASTIRGLHWSSPTTYTSDIFGDTGSNLEATFYARIKRNSATSFDLAVSNDGVYWHTGASANNIEATSGTLDQLGFGICPENGALAGITCHWMRKTA